MVLFFFSPTGFCSHLCECHFLNSSVVFSDLFASCVALDSQLVLHSWAETVFCLSIQPKIISSVFPESPSEGYRSRICARAADLVPVSSHFRCFSWVFTGRDYSLVSMRNQEQSMQNQGPVRRALWPCCKVLAPILSTGHSCNPLVQLKSLGCQIVSTESN